MSHLNPFTATADPERHQAHRQELKRKLAEIAVKKIRLVELRQIIDKLNADSDAAADRHQQAAGALQAELDALDASHVESIMAGRDPSDKALSRRSEIMAELSRLNAELELRCEANRRSVEPVQREWESTRMATAEEGAIRNQLASLCSVETRRRRLLNQQRLAVANSGLQAAHRAVGIHSENVRLCEENERRGFRVTTEKQVAQCHLEDWQSVLQSFERDVAELHQADREIEAAALAE